jgi:hypothetical protein
MLPLVTARPVGFGCGFGGRFCQGKHMAGKLRPLDVERETRPGKYFDGDGLYLVVKGATSRNWIYRFRKDGKERWLGLGSLKDVSLKNARMARDAARLRVKGDRSAPGIDVVQEKRDAREKAKAVEIKVTPAYFRAVRRNLYSRALVDLEHEAPQSMAVFALRACRGRGSP